MQIKIRNNNDEFEYQTSTSWQPLPTDVHDSLTAAIHNFERLSPGATMTLNTAFVAEDVRNIILPLCRPTLTAAGIEIVNIREVSPIAVEITITTEDRWLNYAVTSQPDNTLDVRIGDGLATIGNLPFPFCHFASQNKDQLTILLVDERALANSELLLLWQHEM